MKFTVYLVNLGGVICKLLSNMLYPSWSVCKSIVLCFIILFIIEDQSTKTGKLIECNRVHSIHYNKQNGIDYYYANNKSSRQQQQHNNNKRQTVTANLKSILPANLGSNPYASPSVAATDGELNPDLALAQVSNSVRGRQPKHLAGFNTDQSSNANGQEARTDVGASTQTATGNNRLSMEELSRKQEQTANGVCLTAGCVKAAAEILKNIDDRVDPCDDFYKYSCGNWIEAQVIPEDKTSVSLFSVVQDELDNKLRNLIEKEPSNSDSPIVGKMRNLYESCMNTSKSNQLEEKLNFLQCFENEPQLSLSNYPSIYLNLTKHEILINSQTSTTCFSTNQPTI